MNCFYKKYTLQFKQPSGTSRGELRKKDTYFLILQDKEKCSIGECNRFSGLSFDDRDGYEEKLAEVCNRLMQQEPQIDLSLADWPSIRMGVETVLLDWQNGSKQIIYPNAFQKGNFSVPINGLIWMSTYDEMKKQIHEKLKAGFRSIKLKIGAIDFDAELSLLSFIRKQFSEAEVEIRLDANGAFSFTEAKEKLQRLAEYNISYIEQPIKVGQWQEMALLVEQSPINIALDEELIGLVKLDDQNQLFSTVKPPIIILKPALIGGFKVSDHWKKMITAMGGDWVITSALESNVGLNAIAQYAAADRNKYAQGLGTGQLYTNNIPSPYMVDANGLHYQSSQAWDFSTLI
ncbi:MAG: o-succinylbenzoate synthase [Bacteroidetes bacterium]|nr:o-succinylbenzoate synthase [Bacteroidota bacterium]